MSTNNNKITISRQIAVYKTDKKLIEFLDKLNGAPKETYVHIHAQADESGGKRIYSLIGLILQDYTKGKGDNIVRVNANIMPGEAQFIYNKCAAGVEKFEFTSEKIFGSHEDEGYSKVTKLKILRASFGSNGEPRKFPWYIECENGKGTAAQNANGGSYCKSGSFVSENKVYINISDLDFFKLINSVATYIRIWESQFGVIAMLEGRNEYEVQLAALKNSGGAAAS